MCNSSWKNPDDLILVLRCTTVEFAKKLVNLGQIKFNTPNHGNSMEKRDVAIFMKEHSLILANPILCNMKILLQNIPTPVLMNRQIGF